MNIDEMPAGREMDALVAEKVMGCTSIRRAKYDDFEIMTCECPGKHNVTDPDGRWIPLYSTDITAAWQVLEKLATLYPSRYRTPDVRIFKRGARYEVECCEEVNSMLQSHWILGEADTAPLAICRAALKAVM